MSFVKQLLRSILKERLRDLSPQERGQAAHDLDQRLMALFRPLDFSLLSRPLRIAGYRPHLKTPEVDPEIFLEHLSSAGGEIYFPVTAVPSSIEEGARLSMEGFPVPLKRWQWGSAGFAFVETPETASDEKGNTFRDRSVCPAENLDLVFVPGLAFGRSGERLGRGAGFYDRFLPSAHRALKVGLAFNFQWVEGLPTDPQDFPLDGVVTPGGGAWMNPGRKQEWLASLMNPSKDSRDLKELGQ